MQKINSLMQCVAMTDATVFVTGESGTGKKIVARTIHNLSGRANHPFVPINCVAIPHDFLESEFFGHARGGFTGAHAFQAGMFQLCGGGTIFLDEVAEIPLSLQAKLLRVLQNGEVRPVGTDRAVAVNVRVIAATNQDLARQVEKGAFREDLFYQFQVIPIRLPPLRARRSDIPLLINHLLERSNRKYDTAVEIEPDAAMYLREYDWPGNVRELVNVVTRLVARSENGQIGLSDLPPDIRNFVSDRKILQPALGDEQLDLRSAIRQFEQRFIDEALRLARGNKTKAARMLKLKRTTLVAKLRRGSPSQDEHANDSS